MEEMMKMREKMHNYQNIEQYFEKEWNKVFSTMESKIEGIKSEDTVKDLEDRLISLVKLFSKEIVKQDLSPSQNKTDSSPIVEGDSFCSNCGFKYSSGDTFCRSCGEKIA